MIRINRILTLALLVGALTACSSQSPPPVAAPAAPPAPKTFDTAALVKWYQDCWADFNDRNFDALKNCYASDATSTQLGGNKTELTGAADIIAESQNFAKQFPDVRGEQQLILVHGKRLVSISVLHGTNTGPLIGADGKEKKGTGKKVGFWFGHAIDVAADPLQVVRELQVRDSGSVAMQLGLSKGPGRALLAPLTTPAQVVISADSPTEEQNIATDTAEIVAWNKRDAAATESYQAPDIVVHDTTYAKDMNLAQNTADSKKFWTGFSDGKISYRIIWAAGDYVVVEGQFTGTNDGKLMGVAKTGRKVSLPILEIDRLEGGKIKESWEFYDSGMLAAQLKGTATP